MRQNYVSSVILTCDKFRPITILIGHEFLMYDRAAHPRFGIRLGQVFLAGSALVSDGVRRNSGLRPAFCKIR